MSWLTDIIGAGAKLIGRAVGLKPGPDVKPLSTTFDHWLPPFNSIEAWEVGAGRCFHCLTARSSPEFKKPCPRKRPAGVELA